ncbi:hypothetical protein G9A89_023793 [Geosiphon pyriformis]|nr:hypothetical protein G9A89_023793 [Geosiphon pyriformis]
MGKQLCKTQADGSVHAISIDLVSVHILHGIILEKVRVVHLEDLICKKDKLLASSLKRKNRMASRLDKAIFRIGQNFIRLQSEITYTSKICSQCGDIQRIGGLKCTTAGIVIDRDENGIIPPVIALWSLGPAVTMQEITGITYQCLVLPIIDMSESTWR